MMAVEELRFFPHLGLVPDEMFAFMLLLFGLLEFKFVTVMEY